MNIYMLDTDVGQINLYSIHHDKCESAFKFIHLVNLYRPQTKLREGYVFTRVCDSVHGGGTCVAGGEGGRAWRGWGWGVRGGGGGSAWKERWPLQRVEYTGVHSFFNVFPLEVVQNCQHCQLCVLRENSISTYVTIFTYDKLHTYQHNITVCVCRRFVVLCSSVVYWTLIRRFNIEQSVWTHQPRCICYNSLIV